MRLALALSVLLSLAPPVHAASDHEVRLRAELHASDQASESLFFEATRLWNAREFVPALDRFRQVTKRLPEFWPAYCYAATMEHQLGHRERAIADLRWLLERDTSGYTLDALARVLVNVGGDEQPDSAQTQEAHLLVERALAQLPDDPGLLGTAYWTGLASRDLVAMRDAATALQRVDDMSYFTWYATARVAIHSGDVAGARAAIARARLTDLPPELLASLEADLGSIDRLRLMSTIGHVALWSLPVWLALLGLLTVAGLALSRATLTVADRAMSGPADAEIGPDTWLRRAYSGVIAVSAVNYRLSLPLLLLLVPACGAGLWSVMLFSFVVPRSVQTVVIVTTFAMIGPILRSVFVRGGKSAPGEALDLDAQPRLGAALEEVARRVGTRPVDTVYLTPSTDLALIVRRRGLLMLRSECCLVLGIGVLEGMKLGAWKSVLAHEYGHFVNRGSAGGVRALGLRRSVRTRAHAMAHGGVANWYNPAWWFVRGFEAAFLRVSQGASRLQEVLADRCAARSYGARAFRDGLTHMITESVRFEADTNATLQRALRDKVPLVNLYRHRAPLDSEQAHAVERLTQEALTREPEAYDSHPSPAQRFAWVEKVAAAAPPRHADPGDEDEAWSLFEDREELEAFMTSSVQRDYERRHGVEFAEDPDDQRPESHA